MSRLRSWLALRWVPILATHVALVVGSYVVAYWIRAEFSIPGSWWPGIVQTLPILLVVRLATYWRYGLFRGWWRYTGVNDLVDIAKSVVVSSAFFIAPTILLFGVYAVPRSVVVIDALLQLGLLSGARYLSRALHDLRSGTRSQPPRRAIIVGALPFMESALHEILESPDSDLQPMALFALGGRSPRLHLHGIPVLTDESRLPAIIQDLGVETVLMVVSGREGSTIRRILAACEGAPLRFQILPPRSEVLGDRPPLDDLRDVGVDDLLGRSEIRHDASGMTAAFAGRRVLVTGAAGSIGSELARQLADASPSSLVLLDRNEPHLAAITRELEGRGAHPTPVLCDVGHEDRLGAVFSGHAPEIVFHAAAYKHVPLMEQNPLEAIKNNVVGTKNVLDAADRAETGTVVLISTDKAVRPVTVMGQSKRLAERLLHAPAPRRARRIAVRFGNVLGSEGSVVPILLRQIREGGPVTVTHPEATRYFMTIHEAVHLVLQSVDLGRGGETFVLDMGEPIRILDLARSLIRLSGLEPGSDIEIRFTGLRPGERLHEEALIEPGATGTRHPKIWALREEASSPSREKLLREIDVVLASHDAAHTLDWLAGATRSDA